MYISKQRKSLSNDLEWAIVFQDLKMVQQELEVAHFCRELAFHLMVGHENEIGC